MSSDNEQNIDDSSDLDDLSHFEPDLYPGSDHASDDNMMTPPMDSSDNEDDATFDSAFLPMLHKIDRKNQWRNGVRARNVR